MKVAKSKKQLLALSVAVALAVGFTVPYARVQASAYTADNAPTTNLADIRTPDKLPAMTRQGWRSDWQNPNFEDGNAKARIEYGGPWSFAHIDEIGGEVSDWSSYQVVSVDDAVEGMGRQAGQGDKITTALEITINTDNKQTYAESLTYSQIDDLLYGAVATEDAFYFTAWIKAEQDMWFEVAISYGVKEGYAQVTWDLGRRFFVPAGTWTQIGLDADGNYLPFRAKITDDQWKRGTGSDPTYANSNSSEADTYANESTGDTQIGEYYRDGWGEVWSSLRIYAYGADAYNATNGVGAPEGRNHLSAGDKYLVTGTNFWNQSAPEPTIAKYVDTVTLDKTTASVEVGEELQLTATVSPADADDTSIYWYSSDESVATVDQTGKVTALKEGTAIIYAEANDGEGAVATCEITVTKKATTDPGTTDPGTTDPGTTEEPKKGCGSSILGFGSLGILAGAALTLGAVMIVRRKKD